MPFPLAYVFFFYVFLVDNQRDNPYFTSFCFHIRYSSPQVWRVNSGDVSLRKMGIGKTVDKIINHEKYDAETHDNDIALLKLSTPLTFTSKCWPVK